MANGIRGWMRPMFFRHSSYSWGRTSTRKADPTGDQYLLILQPFRHFTYATAYSPTLPSLYLRHSSFSNPSVASTSQLILQPFFRFSYVTCSSLTSPGEPPMQLWCTERNWECEPKSYLEASVYTTLQTINRCSKWNKVQILGRKGIASY